MVVTKTYRNLFTYSFVAFNVGYAIIAMFFFQWWSEKVLFRTGLWMQGLEKQAPVWYITLGAAFLCMGISAVVWVLNSSGIHSKVQEMHMKIEIVNWLAWTGFEIYFATYATSIVIGIVQVILCVVIEVLAVLAFMEARKDR